LRGRSERTSAARATFDRADATATGYHNEELRRIDREQDRQDRQREAAANRANARYVVDKQMSGKSTKADSATEPDRAISVLDALDELSGRINTQQGITARAGGVWASAAARANYDDDLAEYSAVLDGAVPLIARRMGHTGVLTQADVDSVKSMFPKAGDSKTLRDRKMARVRSLMGGNGGSGNGSGSTRSKFRVSVE
jgi:hypothetical protein